MDAASINVILNIVAVLLGGGALGVVLRFVAKLKELRVGQHATDREAEAKLRDALIIRVEKLETKIERLQTRHAAERSLGSHQLQNITACFDATLLMLEMNPDRGPEIVVKIKAMRSAQMVAEAQEKAIIRAAEMEMDKREAEEEEGEGHG